MRPKSARPNVERAEGLCRSSPISTQKHHKMFTALCGRAPQ